MTTILTLYYTVKVLKGTLFSTSSELYGFVFRQEALSEASFSVH